MNNTLYNRKHEQEVEDLDCTTEKSTGGKHPDLKLVNLISHSDDKGFFFHHNLMMKILSFPLKHHLLLSPILSRFAITVY